MVKNRTKNAGSSDEKEPPNFEENLQRLEAIVSELEQGGLALDKSLKLYEEGIQAYRACHEMLQKADARIAKLVETLEGALEEEPFEPPEDTDET